MPDLTLTVLDVTSIQRYVFGSNRLQENIGASELVHRATHQWAFSNLPRPNNVADVETGELTDARIEDGGLAAEVVYAGGGNTLILFADDSGGERVARTFTANLGRTLIQEAPGLELVAAHVSLDWHQEPLGGSDRGRVAVVIDRLDGVKRGRATSVPVMGLGVTAACQSTGLAAVGTHPRYGYLISAEVAAKLDLLDSANRRLIGLLPAITTAGLDVPFDFDDFGRSRGEVSYIAVVHADGNQMGKRVQGIASQHVHAGEGNREYVAAMRSFSTSIEDASQRALSATVDALLSAVSDAGPEEGRWIDGRVPIRDNKIPFRPLVFGGDDLTFVCDGRLGLSLAACYLQAFERETKKTGVDACACAGVAVVKTHYPFARAYQLAESLSNSAKKKVRDTQDNDAGDFSALDWHFAVSGLLGDLHQIREREYHVPGIGRLYMRPIRLWPTSGDWRTWGNFSNVADAFRMDEEWAGRRNKVMGLFRSLRGGEASVRQFCRAYGLRALPEMKEQSRAMPTSGWDGDTCAYFDPIEAMEFYVPLGYEQEDD